MDPSLTAIGASSNPKYLNLYQVNRLYSNPPNGKHTIQLDQAITSAWPETGSGTTARIYQFITADLTAGTDQQVGFKYVSECSNRGNCLEDSGICDCFEGFTSAACSYQNNLNS